MVPAWSRNLASCLSPSMTGFPQCDCGTSGQNTTATVPPWSRKLRAVFVVVGLGREGQMVVLRPRRVFEESFHPRRNLRVVEELDVREFCEQFGVKPFPREVAGAVEPYGGDKSKSSGFFFQAAYFDGQHLQEELLSSPRRVRFGGRERVRGWASASVRWSGPGTLPSIPASRENRRLLE